LTNAGINGDNVILCSSEDGNGINKLVQLTDSLAPKALTIFKEFRQKLSSCFIATTVYENPQHMNIITLRNFRDNFLNTFYLGKCFIDLYYYFGPYLARLLYNRQTLKTLVRKLLDVIVSLMKFIGHINDPNNEDSW